MKNKTKPLNIWLTVWLTDLDMKELTDNLIEKMLIATKATSIRNLANLLQISPQAMYKAIKKHKIPRAWINKVSEITDYKLEWFYEPFITANINQIETKKQILEKDKNQTVEPVSVTDSDVFIPIVKARLSAGSGSFITDSEIENKIRFEKSFFVNRGNPKDMVIMRVMGDSMQPEIMDNDYVMIDQSKIDIEPNRIFAVGFEDCIYLKRIDLLPKQVVLKSVNPAYPPVVLDIQEDMASLFRVIGKVLWVGREYN